MGSPWYFIKKKEPYESTANYQNMFIIPFLRIWSSIIYLHVHTKIVIRVVIVVIDWCYFPDMFFQLSDVHRHQPRRENAAVPCKTPFSCRSTTDQIRHFLLFSNFSKNGRVQTTITQVLPCAAHRKCLKRLRNSSQPPDSLEHFLYLPQ